MTKNLLKTFFVAAILHPLWANLRPLLSITFPHGFQKYKKKFGHWTLGSGGKRPVNGVRNTNTNKIMLSKAKFAKKPNKKLCGDFTTFFSQSFQIWDHFFPLLFLKDSKSLKFLRADALKMPNQSYFLVHIMCTLVNFVYTISPFLCTVWILWHTEAYERGRNRIINPEFEWIGCNRLEPAGIG